MRKKVEPDATITLHLAANGAFYHIHMAGHLAGCGHRQDAPRCTSTQEQGTTAVPTTAKARLRLIHSDTNAHTTCPCGQLRTVDGQDRSYDSGAQLVRDLVWFSERVAEIGQPANLAEQSLLDCYQAMISHRRTRLLDLRATLV